MANVFDQFDESQGNVFDQFDAQTQVSDPSLGEQALGALETAGVIASGAISEPLAGWAGIGAQILPGGDTGGEAVKRVRNLLSIQPESEASKRQLQAIGETLEPIGEAFGAIESGLGEAVLDATGIPELAAVAHTLPTAALEALGVGAGRWAAKSVPSRPQTIADRAVESQRLIDQAAAAEDVIQAGEQFGVPVLTTDVMPPKTYLGRFSQSLSEKLGPLGSGKSRAIQQEARERAVEGLADNLDIDLDTDFAAQVVDSLNKSSAKKLENAGKVRREAILELSQYGDIDVSNTSSAVAKEIAKQERLGPMANADIIQDLQNAEAAIKGGNFEQAALVRSEIIKELQKIRRGEDVARSEPIYQAVKSAIDKDMDEFAKANSRSSAAKWKKSNRQFADELDKTKNTELKRVLNSGTATPEQVMPILKGGKKSQLDRIYKSLGEKGKAAARSAIIQDALKEAKFFEVDANPNPTAFANAMNKPNRQMAVRTFFKGADKAEIDGLTRLLDATREAQSASQALKTGEQLVAPAIGGASIAGLTLEPTVALPAITSGVMLAKAYESAPFRNLLIRLSKSKAKSKQEAKTLERLGALIGAVSPAASTGQEQTEQ